MIGINHGVVFITIMKTYFRDFQLRTRLHGFYRNLQKFFYLKIFHWLIPDEIVIKHEFKNRLGYELNLDAPRTFNEKINWINLNSRNPLRKIVADKYAARDYIRETVGAQYLIPLVYHTDNASDLKPENLPDFPFIIKCNHTSGGGVIVRDKSQIDWADVQSHFAKLLKLNYYKLYRERQYKHIKPSIIVEKLLLDENNVIAYDYKIDCINGKVDRINVVIDRFTDRKANKYDRDWNLIDMSVHRRGKEIEKPELFDEMLYVAERIARDFRFIRVDCYYVRGKIYVGELTLTPMVGMIRFSPEEWDQRLGDKLKL